MAPSRSTRRQARRRRLEERLHFGSQRGEVPKPSRRPAASVSTEAFRRADTPVSGRRSPNLTYELPSLPRLPAKVRAPLPSIPPPLGLPTVTTVQPKILLPLPSLFRGEGGLVAGAPSLTSRGESSPSLCPDLELKNPRQCHPGYTRAPSVLVNPFVSYECLSLVRRVRHATLPSLPLIRHSPGATRPTLRQGPASSFCCRGSRLRLARGPPVVPVTPSHPSSFRSTARTSREIPPMYFTYFTYQGSVCLLPKSAVDPPSTLG